MVDWELFLTQLYVTVDDVTKALPRPRPSVGHPVSLAPSEVVTLALFGQWMRFRTERDFYRWADRHLRSAFPTLPDLAQLNRRMRASQHLIVAVFRHLADALLLPTDLYEALDTTAAPTRDAKRRGHGWLWGQADIGISKRIGWFEGFRVVTAVRASGVITGFGFAPASTKDQPVATTFLAARCDQHPRLESVGAWPGLPYAADKGFEGRGWHALWRDELGAELICPPKKNLKLIWPPYWSHRLASIRQIVETANASLHIWFGLERSRPHTLSGFAMRLAAKVALHNFCIWMNRQLGRPDLAFADLIDW